MIRLLPIAFLSLAACAPETRQIDGKAAFQSQCAGCHGTGAQGDGPMAASLTPTPPDLTGLSRRNGGIFPQDYVMSVIDGFNRGAHFSDAMPRFGDGDLGPIIMTSEDGNPMPVPAELLALSNYVETLQR